MSIYPCSKFSLIINYISDSVELIVNMTRYLAPYATVELALILINSGQIDEAGLLLETAKYVHDDDDDDDHYHDLGDGDGNHKW